MAKAVRREPRAKDFKITKRYLGTRFVRRSIEKTRSVLLFARNAVKGPFERRAERRLLTEITAKVPNHGDRVRYLDEHVGKRLDVESTKGKPHLGGSLAKQIIRRYWEAKRRDKRNEYIFLPKELEHVPFKLALGHSLNAVINSKAMRRGRGRKEKKLRKIIQKVFKEGRISFEDKTNVAFTSPEMSNIKRILGEQDGSEFIKTFRENLLVETGWTRDYIRRKIERILLQPWDRPEGG